MFSFTISGFVRIRLISIIIPPNTIKTHLPQKGRCVNSRCHPIYILFHVKQYISHFMDNGHCRKVLTSLRDGILYIFLFICTNHEFSIKNTHILVLFNDLHIHLSIPTFKCQCIKKRSSKNFLFFSCFNFFLNFRF